MPKLKQGKRHHVSAERKHYACSRINHCRHTPLEEVTNIMQSSSSILSSLIPPAHTDQLPLWHVTKHDHCVELFLIQKSAPSVVKFSLVVSEDLEWKISVFNKPVPNDHQMYEELQTTVTTFEVVCEICTYIQKMSMCEGNGDDFFC